MPFIDKLKEIERNREIIEGYGKLPDEILKKINYKFRLEWNYTSNSMEGNSLTRQETRSVMVGNITVQGKPIQDIREMQSHDEVITTIMKIGRGELNISEKRIKEIHKGIMYEPDKEKAKKIGHWKTDPNYLYNYKNERFDFIAPADVPERMHKLIDGLNARKERIKEPVEAVELAFWFHLEYIVIHPFYDGNGRTARILTNLILISYGFPPIYINEKEKGIYYQYLADIQGYGGDPGLFYEFMAGLLIRSQQIVLDALEGKEIEEADDVLKEITLWKKHLNDQTANIKTNTRVGELYKESISPFFDEYASKMRTAFRDLFDKWEETGFVNQYGVGGEWVSTRQKEYIDKEINTILKSKKPEDINKVSYHIHMKEFKKDGMNKFNSSADIQFEFLTYEYRIMFNHREHLKTKLYSEDFSPNEQREMITLLVKKVLTDIQEKIKNPHIRKLLE